MDNETKARRRELLRMQTEIEEQQCADCPDAPGRSDNAKACTTCPYGMELMTIGHGLDQALGPRRGGHTQVVAPALTDEVIARAAANDIPKEILRIRVQQLYWPLEKAVTQPVDTSKRHKEVGA